MAFSFGIMQGRLTPSNGRGIQFFPFDNWEQEFEIARSIGLDEIEFIFDFDRYQENPLWTGEGVKQLNEVIGRTGVKVHHICADFFMRQPFFRVEESVRQENIKIFKTVIERAKQIGAGTIEIPLVDNSSIKTEEEKKLLISSLQEIVPFAEKAGITLTLETDLPPKSFRALLEEINHPMIKANYDTGNSSGLGYDPYEEITTLGNLVHNVHIKDRVLGGTTVPLGTGSANFDRFFQAIKETGYTGSFILQAARQEEGMESEAIKEYLEFVKGYISKYLT